MSAVGYFVQTEAAVALAAGVAKSVIGVVAQAAAGLQLKSFEIGFDGVTASAVPVLIEIGYCTFAGAGTGTGTTPRQSYGRVLAAGFTSFRNYTVEPTVVTPLKEFLLTPNAGLIAYQFPLGQEPDTAFAQGFVIRLTAPAIVNVRATMGIERV
jgi:hypothetical protein